MYAGLRLLDPLIRVWWRGYGLGNVVELVTPGRRTGRPRSVLVGLLVADGQWYVGHPNRHVSWTRNLAAAGEGTVRVHGVAAVAVTAVLLPPGHERDAAIRATSQHPFPGNVIYRLARRHIQAVGVYFRLDPLRPGASSPGDQPAGASSNVSNVKAGDTVQPTSDQAPVDRARCQAPSGTMAWGVSPPARSSPRRWTATRPLSSIHSSTGAPA